MRWWQCLIPKMQSVWGISYDAIELQPEYLEWDDNYVFEVTCVRAIYYIGKEKAYPHLEKMCEYSNAIIREMAQRQLKKRQ